MVRNPAGMLDEERMKELLARNLETFMRERGITQATLAKQSGLLKSTLNTYFTRKSFPNPEKLQKLADALDVGLEDLVPSVDRDAIRAMVRGEPQQDDAPGYAMRGIPGRPGLSWLEVRGEMPTAVAMQIMTLVMSVESAEQAIPVARGDAADAGKG